MPYVYMLQCADGSYYVGSTRHLQHRMHQHALGCGGAYTSARLPVRLVWFEEYERIEEAYAMERRLHGWGRRKRELLIKRDYEALRGSGSRARRRGNDVSRGTEEAD